MRNGRCRFRLPAPNPSPVAPTLTCALALLPRCAATLSSWPRMRRHRRRRRRRRRSLALLQPSLQRRAPPSSPAYSATRMRGTRAAALFSPFISTPPQAIASLSLALSTPLGEVSDPDQSRPNRCSRPSHQWIRSPPLRPGSGAGKAPLLSSPLQLDGLASTACSCPGICMDLGLWATPRSSLQGHLRLDHVVAGHRRCFSATDPLPCPPVLTLQRDLEPMVNRWNDPLIRITHGKAMASAHVPTTVSLFGVFLAGPTDGYKLETVSLNDASAYLLSKSADLQLGRFLL